MKFVIFHGAYGSPAGNWFPWLKEELTNLGHEVLIPTFPTPQNQTLDYWIKTFEPIANAFNNDEEIVFIGHSLGCVFMLHIIEKYTIHLRSAIFVSPFLSGIGKPEFDKVNASFYKEDFDFTKLQTLIPQSYTFYSDNDPYVHKELSVNFAEKLQSEQICIKNGGHLNSEAGFTEFTQLLNICKSLQ
jgi:uncharacterized protein